ncbi:MAG TPA: SoxR reducing system RseC family protein [Bacillota bacterium]|nr:SoxR reducing system RseC family protein [Bacillota bacterium]
MIPSGIITKRDGPYAEVYLVRQSACQNCRACSLGASENAEMHIRALNETDAQVGDRVEINFTGQIGSKVALLTYGIPLVSLFAGYLLLALLTKQLPFETSQAIAGVGCIILAFLSFFLLKFLEPKLRQQKSLIPIVSKILQPENEKQEC